MDPDVVRPDIDAIEAAPFATANGHVVDFAVGAGIQRVMVHGRVNKGDVVDREVGDLVSAEETRAFALPLRGVNLVAITFWTGQR